MRMISEEGLGARENTGVSVRIEHEHGRGAVSPAYAEHDVGALLARKKEDRLEEKEEKRERKEENWEEAQERLAVVKAFEKMSPDGVLRFKVAPKSSSSKMGGLGGLEPSEEMGKDDPDHENVHGGSKVHHHESKERRKQQHDEERARRHAEVTDRYLRADMRDHSARGVVPLQTDHSARDVVPHPKHHHLAAAVPTVPPTVLFQRMYYYPADGEASATEHIVSNDRRRGDLPVVPKLNLQTVTNAARNQNLPKHKQKQSSSSGGIVLQQGSVVSGQLPVSAKQHMVSSASLGGGIINEDSVAAHDLLHEAQEPTFPFLQTIVAQNIALTKLLAESGQVPLDFAFPKASAAVELAGTCFGNSERRTGTPDVNIGRSRSSPDFPSRNGGPRPPPRPARTRKSPGFRDDADTTTRTSLETQQQQLNVNHSTTPLFDATTSLKTLPNSPPGPTTADKVFLHYDDDLQQNPRVTVGITIDHVSDKDDLAGSGETPWQNNDQAASEVLLIRFLPPHPSWPHLPHYLSMYHLPTHL